MRQANEKFIAYERTRQFPYLIGRNSLPEPSLYRYTLCYELSNSDNTTDRSYVCLLYTSCHISFFVESVH